MTKPFAELLNTNVHIDISLQADMLGLIRPKYRNSKQRGTGGKISISLLEITDIYISVIRLCLRIYVQVLVISL